MNVDIISIDIRRGFSFQFGFLKTNVWSGDFWKQIMPWTFYDGGLHLAQINYIWNICHVSCPLAVDSISFILVVMDIINDIFKDQNGDGSPLYWMF